MRTRTTLRGRSSRKFGPLFAVPLLVTLAMSVAGCGCPTALLPGVLVAIDGDLAMREDAGGFMRQVRWPFGYRVEARGAQLVLLDPFGGMPAREGDHVALPGGETESDGPWGVCGEIEVLD